MKERHIETLQDCDIYKTDLDSYQIRVHTKESRAYRFAVYVSGKQNPDLIYDFNFSDMMYFKKWLESSLDYSIELDLMGPIEYIKYMQKEVDFYCN